MTQRFDRFMVMVDIGTNRKLRRLPVAQRWAYVSGVLALAAQSPIRGALLIHDGYPVSPEDVAEEATVSLSVARAALGSLRQLGMLERDSDGVEWVHDWDSINPDPKPSDSPEAWRERKRKQRAAAIPPDPGHAAVTRDTSAMSRPGHAASSRERARSPEGVEVEVEEQLPPDPPQAGEDPFPERPEGKRRRDVGKYERAVVAWMTSHFPGTPLGAEQTVASWASEIRKVGVEPTVSAIRSMAEHNNVDLTEPLAARVAARRRAVA